MNDSKTISHSNDFLPACSYLYLIILQRSPYNCGIKAVNYLTFESDESSPYNDGLRDRNTMESLRSSLMHNGNLAVKNIHAPRDAIALRPDTSIKQLKIIHILQIFMLKHFRSYKQTGSSCRNPVFFILCTNQNIFCETF